MKKIKSFKEYSKVYEDNAYYDPNYSYERDGGTNYNSEIETETAIDDVPENNSIIDMLAQKAAKIVEVLMKFGSITNQEELHAKVAETLNKMYQTYSDPAQKEALNKYRNKIINKTFEILNEKGLDFDTEKPY